MFTGLVEAQGQVLEQKAQPGGLRMLLSHSFEQLSLGESISVNGACLTVIEFDTATFCVEMSNETLDLTTLGTLGPGDAVNMERALLPTTRLGGHLVTGHIDARASVARLVPEGEMTRVSLTVPLALMRYIAKKGSLTVDGVSLTVNEIEGERVDLLLIPHTQAVTNLGRLERGTLVNIEVDLLARYVERLFQGENAPALA